jgi:hypothetical protein
MRKTSQNAPAAISEYARPGSDDPARLRRDPDLPRSQSSRPPHDADHAGVVGLDRDPDVDFGRRALRLHSAGAERHVQSEGQTAARDGCRADDERAAREFRAELTKGGCGV